MEKLVAVLNCRMSLENEDQSYSQNASGNFDVVLKGPKLSYTRELLVSLSNLDICKKLPSGFDEALLSEFQGTSESIQDRPRIPGSLPLQSFRQNQYGSSPPAQGDPGNYSRGIHGKWESRSSEKGDRDTDSQSDRDSESGRRVRNQARGSWQTHEPDGLLGSGSFPRPFANASGMLAPKIQANEHYQLSKSNEPYHPPRPYKAVQSRRDTDSYNDETFGSVEGTSEDRTEEERKRRASFEMMRKEQQKVLQEKQKSNLKNQKDGISDLCEDLDDSKEERGHFVTKNELEASAAIPITINDFEKCSFASRSPASRPLVPPGFQNNVLDKNSGAKSLIRPPSSVVFWVCLSDPEANRVQSNTNDGLERQLSQEINLVDGQPAEKDHISHGSSHFNFRGTLDDFGIVELHPKVSDYTVSEFNQNYSTSALENFFGSTLSMKSGGSTSAEHHDSKPDDTWRPDSVLSSKFARWFFDEEVKTVDTSSGRPNDILSLIVNGDKGRCQVSDSEAAERFPPDFSSKTSEQSDQFKVDIMSSDNGVASQLSINNDEETILAVLTCEDLEQSILSEYSAKNTAGLSVSKGWSSSSANTEQQNVHVVDGHASANLLSLLQKGTERIVNSGVDTDLGDKISGSQDYDVETTVNIRKWDENNSNVLSSVNTLTLETLFGTAFMKELQSVEAPVSVQRGSIGSAQVDVPDPPGFPFPVSDNGLSSPRRNEFCLQRPSHDYGILASNNKQQTNMSKAENWNGFDGSLTDTSSKHHTEAAPMHIGLHEGAEIQLPELSSISSSDPRDHWMSRFMSIGSSSNGMNSSLDGLADIMDKLTAISSVKDQQLVGGLEKRHFVSDPYEQMEPHIPYRSLQMQQSLPQFQTPQMSRVRPLYHHLDSHPAHTNPQMKLRGPDTMFNNDSLAYHQIQSSMSRPSFPTQNVPTQNVKVAGFEIPSHHSVLHQQMQMSGNHPPHMLPDFSKGGNQAAYFLPEMHKMQNYPLGHHTPKIGSRGVPYTDINSGGNPYEAFQRLIEMERLANSKQSHPFATGHNRGNHGYE